MPGRFSVSWVAGVSGTLLASVACGVQAIAAEVKTPTSVSPPVSVRMAQGEPQLSTELRAILAGQSISGVITSRTPSPIRLSIPSLWWISDQLADLQQFGNKFIQEWIAYPLQPGKPGRVDLLVNRQQWSLLDYFQRYQFVSKFSAIARSFGYNVRVYDHPDRIPVALYTCDFVPATGSALKSATAAQSSPPMTVPPATSQAEGVTHPSCRLDMTGMANLRRP